MSDLIFHRLSAEEQETGSRNWWVLLLLAALFWASIVLYVPGMP